MRHPSLLRRLLSGVPLFPMHHHRYRQDFALDKIDSNTGAIAKSPGRFREAEGGTIFLDEIGELPLDAQVKLLRVLQEKEIYPVGSDKAIPVNVRIISATNRDLEAEGCFRDDLYFRLNVLPIHMPSLRQRTHDIMILVNHFIERFSASEGRSLKKITSAAEAILSAREWGGNVRELENTIHRAMVLCDGDVLDVDDFTALPIGGTSLVSGDMAVPEYISETALAMLDVDGHLKTMDQIEQAAMQFSPQYHDNNVTQAARALNMAKSTFYRKLKQ